MDKEILKKLVQVQFKLLAALNELDNHSICFYELQSVQSILFDLQDMLE